MLRTFILFLFIQLSLLGQETSFKPFSGCLTYKVELVDSNMKKGKFQYYMRVYTNDTIVRTENESILFGKQILIKHLKLNKQYLLLSYNDKKYAIQQHLKPDTTTVTKYQFEIKQKFKKFAKKKSQLAITTVRNFPFKFNTYFTTDLNPIYLDLFKGINGLPTQYYLPSDNGILRYTLVEIEETKLPASTFLFSKDHIKITFDEFIKIATESDKSK